MHADYHHSRKKPAERDGGGAIFTKFLKSIDSAYTEVTTKDGRKTTFMAELQNFKDEVEGVPRIACVSPMPAREDAGSIFTNFTSYRAATSKRTWEIAQRTEKFIKNELPMKVWELFNPDQAKKILAEMIIGRMAMGQSVTAQDMESGGNILEETVQPVIDPEEEALEENSIHPEYEEVESEVTMETGNTRQSTKLKLTQAQEENEKLEDENEALRQQQEEEKKKATAHEAQMERMIALLRANGIDIPMEEGDKNAMKEQTTSTEDRQIEHVSEEERQPPTPSKTHADITPAESPGTGASTRNRRSGRTRRTSRGNSPEEPTGVG